MWPVIQPSSFNILVFQAKPQGFDQVQRGLSGCAQAGNISSVWGDFWLKKNKLHGICSALPLATLMFYKKSLFAEQGFILGVGGQGFEPRTSTV
jgi:hypothetical protein